MNCPSCPGELIAIVYEGEKIHTCPACKGILLDEQRLHAIELKRDEKISRNQGHSEPNHYEGTRICPDCDARMKKPKYGKYFPRTVDECPECGNIWLDKGELEDIQVAFEIYEENTNKVKR